VTIILDATEDEEEAFYSNTKSDDEPPRDNYVRSQLAMNTRTRGRVSGTNHEGGGQTRAE
jgi:hypothetical protein